MKLTEKSRYKIDPDDFASDQTLKEERGWLKMDVRWMVTDKTIGSESTVVGRTIMPPGVGAKHALHRHPNAEQWEYIVFGTAIKHVGMILSFSESVKLLSFREMSITVSKTLRKMSRSSLCGAIAARLASRKLATLFLEMQMGHGLPPALRFLAVGIRPSISIDVVTTVPSDMFNAMRALLAGTRLMAHRQALEEGTAVDPPPLTSRDVLEFATLQGAKACGIDHKTGSLTPGKEADLVLIDSNRMNLIPMNNPVGAVVEFANVGNVDSIFVAGRARKRHGRLLDLDFAAFRRRVDAIAMRSSLGLVSPPTDRGSSRLMRKNQSPSSRRRSRRSFARRIL
jgi:hypothetical protein